MGGSHLLLSCSLVLATMVPLACKESDEVEYLDAWLTDRLVWIDDHIDDLGG